MDTTTTTGAVATPAPAVSDATLITQRDLMKTYVLRSSLAIVGGVSAVIYATSKGHKGRFWWFLGGSLVGGALGMIIGIATSKTPPPPGGTTTALPSNFVDDYTPKSTYATGMRGTGTEGGPWHSNKR